MTDSNPPPQAPEGMEWVEPEGFWPEVRSALYQRRLTHEEYWDMPNWGLGQWVELAEALGYDMSDAVKVYTEWHYADLTGEWVPDVMFLVPEE